MTIYVAAWHVKSESGDGYMGQVALTRKNLNLVLEDIIKECPEVEAYMCDSDLDQEYLTPEEVLDECLLYPDIHWLEIDEEGYAQLGGN